VYQSATPGIPHPRKLFGPDCMPKCCNLPDACEFLVISNDIGQVVGQAEDFFL
jgi:hypothetical protein